MKQKLVKPILWLKKRTKRQLILLVVGVLIVGAIVYGATRNNSTKTILPVQKGSIEEEVLVTGKTESRSSVDLGFEKGGKVVSSPFEVGSRVQEGQILAALDQSELLANLQKASANVRQAEIELEATSRKSSLSNETAKASLLASLKDAYIKSDDAIHNGVDQFFKNPRDFDAVFDPSFTDSGTTYYGGIPDATKRDIAGDRVKIEALLTAWKTSQQSLAFGSKINIDVDQADTNLRIIRTFLDKVASAINSLPTTDYKYNATIQGYKTTIANARAEVVTANTNLIDAEDKFNNAPTVSAGSTYEDVQIQQTKVASYKADEAAIRADMAKAVLRAPISGVVTKMEAKRGEIVTAGTSLITLISDEKLQIEANVSEVNIAKVTLGNPVSVTFDAIPDQVFTAKVVYIDPAAVVVDGVPTYKITVAFDDPSVLKPGSLVRSGLTANLKIETKKLEDRIKIPAYAVEKKGDKSIVKVSTAEGTEEREVVTGIQGKDGSIEIVSGLEVGESVLVVGTK